MSQQQLSFQIILYIDNTAEFFCTYFIHNTVLSCDFSYVFICFFYLSSPSSISCDFLTSLKSASASDGRLNPPFLSAVLHEGGRRRAGGHFRGVSDNRGEEAAGGEGDSQEDVRFFLPHHQSSGGQHGAAGGPADQGERHLVTLFQSYVTCCIAGHVVCQCNPEVLGGMAFI